MNKLYYIYIPFTLLLTCLMLIIPQDLDAQRNRKKKKKKNGNRPKMGINTPAPTATLDVNGDLRIRDGAETNTVLVSDSSGTGSWSKLSTIMPNKLICVTDFGAIGDGITDDTNAMQAAIDSAGVVGALVCVPYGIYKFSSTLILPDGVVLVGDGGMGSTPLGTPFNGTLLTYTGNNWAVQLEGHNSGLRDLTIRDDNAGNASGGVKILAKGRLVESFSISHVMISNFTGGTAFQLKAKEGGGIAFGTARDLRIRHAKKGIQIVPLDSSFVNTNSFFAGVISGGGYDYCLQVKGGNDNKFYGMAIESYQSTYGHIVVEEGNIIGDRLRVEGVSQPSNTPLIDFKIGTSGSCLDGKFSGGLVLDHGVNFVKFVSSKSMSVHQPRTNELVNMAFQGLASGILPFWQVSGAGVTVETLNPQLISSHNVLKLTVPAGQISILKPEASAAPEVMDLREHQYCNFGAYIKTDQPGIVSSVFNDFNGVITSSPHPGDDDWHYIGMRGKTKTSEKPSPQFMVDNSSGSSAVVVYLSSPSFTFGLDLPSLEAKPLSTAGGQMFGTLITGMTTVTTPTNHFLNLPKEGNVFLVSNDAGIYRLNHEVVFRFPKGTVVTLLFDSANTLVLNSPYISLKGTGNFVGQVNSSLTLLSMGDGTWRELGRNN